MSLKETNFSYIQVSRLQTELSHRNNFEEYWSNEDANLSETTNKTTDNKRFDIYSNNNTPVHNECDNNLQSRFMRYSPKQLQAQFRLNIPTNSLTNINVGTKESTSNGLSSNGTNSYDVTPKINPVQKQSFLPHTPESN